MDTIIEYEAQIPEKWRASYFALKKVAEEHLPAGFQLVLQYGMPTFMLPLSIYPAGYLNRTNEPLPFVSIGVQKRYLALYHLGLLGNPALLAWFKEEYVQQVPTKLNLGKSCLRFTNPQQIPYELIGQLLAKISVTQWCSQYEKYQQQKANKNTSRAVD